MQPTPALDQGYDPNKNYPKVNRERMEYDPMDDTPEGCGYRYGSWICDDDGGCWCDGADY